MSTRYITGAIGAVIGYFIGGPQGAYYGWVIGSTVGQIIDPGTIRGPSLNDLGQQTSQEGGPRPIIFGLSPPMSGNIIVTGPVKKVKVKKSQGKGSPKVVTEELHRTYAIGVCEGPITRFVRIWRNGELVYNGQTPEEFNIYDLQNPTNQQLTDYILRVLSNNLKWFEKCTFYLGDYTQVASPHLEQLFGVGTTPAHRGTAYMLVHNDDLTDYRGAVPQFVFQVERCEGYALTSRPYPVEAEDGLGLSFAVQDSLDWTPPDEALDMAFGVTGGDLEADVIEYPDAEDEALDLGPFAVVDGDLDETLLVYSDAEPEALDLGPFAVEDGVLDDALIVYDDAEDEALDLGPFAVTGGTLA
jgi:hypothetical protein